MDRCMHLNVVVLAGTLATDPEFRQHDTGATILRLLLTVRTTVPRQRVDVIPVTMWDPPEDLTTGSLARGTRLWVAGAVHRRFWEAPAGRRSRLEIVARQVQIDPEQPAADDSAPRDVIPTAVTATDTGSRPAPTGSGRRGWCPH